MTPPRRTSPRRKSPTKSSQSLQVGKRTGVIVPPRGAIPLNSDGFEDVDAFWDAARSPVGGLRSSSNRGGDNASGGGSGNNSGGGKEDGGRGGSKKSKKQTKQLQLQQLESETRHTLAQKPTFRRLEQGYEGIATPRNAVGWSNRNLHRAMGIPTPGSELSRVTAASVATSVASKGRGRDSLEANAGVVVQQAKEAEDPIDEEPAEEEEEEPQGPMDPPEEMSETSKRGMDPEENENAVDPEEEIDDEGFQNTGASDDGRDGNDNDGFSNDNGFDDENNKDDSNEKSPDNETDAKSATSGKSSGITPDMENSMEEMMDKYDNRYNDDEDKESGGGFQLSTQEEGFDNDYDGFEEEEQVEVASKKSRGKDASDEENEKVSTKSSRRGDSSDEEEEKASTKHSKHKYSSDEEEEQLSKKPKARSKKDKSKAPVTPTSVLRTKGSKKKKNETNRVNWSTPNGTLGYPTANRDYELIPVSEFTAKSEAAATPGGTKLRRSKRAHVPPLQFWKNEKYVYAAQNEAGILGEAMGDMPVVKEVMRALPTPHKERPKKESKKEEPKKKRRRTEDGDDDGEERNKHGQVPFDPTQLMRKYRIINGEHGTVWSEAMEDTAEIKLVSRLENRSFSKLPLSTTRSKKESKVVGFASQSFHVPTDQDDLFPGYISGNVVLPPKGIKDAEGVGLCSQVFNVGDCQPNSVEFAVADPASQDGEFDPATAQRFLLSKGDMFQIPPGNVYRIENHSRVEEARLFWTIIKCTSRAEQQQDSDEE